jgi:DNA (cytosine-5)-methyltransferase 1
VRDPLSTIVQRGTTQNPVTIRMEPRRDHSDAVTAFLVEYYGNGKSRDVRDPIGTVTTKDRFALISSRLQDYGIVDIGMRMLSNRELARAMSVPDDFDLCEDELTKTSITAKIGNGVPRLVVEAILKANADDYAKPQRLSEVA